MFFHNMKSYYEKLDLKRDGEYQKIHRLIEIDMDNFSGSVLQTKSRLHTSIATHFEPVIFLDSPFFYEMGIRNANSWGLQSKPVDDLFKKRQRDIIYGLTEVAKALSDFNSMCAHPDADHNTHLGLYRTPTPGFDTDHNSIGYTMLFKKGLSGILSEIAESKKRFSEDSDEYSFCCASEESILAVIKTAHKFANAAKDALCHCENSTQEKYMKMIEEAADHIPENPPRSFYEGLAMIWFMREVTGSMEGIGISVLGRVDLLLGELYENDIRYGILTEAEARELIRLWLMPTDIKFRSFESKWPETSTCITLGGCDSKGEFVFNDVTRLIIDEHCSMNLIAPKLNVRYSKNSPKEYLKLISRKILKGYNNFALSCDDIVIPSLEKCGFDRADARRYVNGGCQESMVEGAGHTAGAYMYIFLPTVLDMSLNPSEVSVNIESENMRGALPDIICDAPDFESFYSMFLSNLKKLLEKAAENQVIIGKEQKNLNPCPLFSSMHEGCIKNGKDYTEGGAKYNFSTICFCGLGTLIDSLYSIKAMVFDRKNLSLKSFADILRNNWEGSEELRLECIKLPKYGHGINEVDMIAERLVEDIDSFVLKIRNERGGTNITSMFSYYLYKLFAKYVRATADGRKDGDLISQGISPGRLVESRSITEVLETVKNVKFNRLSGISVLDLVLTPNIGEDNLVALIKTASECECPNLQLNCLSRKQLTEAKEHPEKHKDLIVRLAGLSVYFVNLEASMQDEVIGRSIIG
ncbi:MAG: hypothetical protein IKJ91_05680 [Clostridia bacterium]|nr:hypothetical protein [Clostridia bacterium]